MKDFKALLFEEFNIAVINKNKKIWMLRTESGRYYQDFTTNKYVALGWNKVPYSLLIDKDISDKVKKEKIQLLYPDETKPGLILGQLTTFYFKMKPGDFILIPSKSSKYLFIGKLKDIITDVKHKETDKEYCKCQYLHKRSVEWIKEISPSVDVYLTRTLRSHQAITNISEYSDLYFRNIFPCYIDENTLHFTLQKHTESNYSLCDSIKLQSSIVEILKLASELYGSLDNSESYIIKTAVGSPGIIELIIQNFNIENIIGILFIMSIVGVNSTVDSSGKKGFSIGIGGIIDKVNNLINDHKNRQLIDAEIRIKEAEAKRINAETEKIQAEARKTLSESKKIDVETRQIEQQLLSIPSAKKIEDTKINLSQPMQTLKQVTEKNEIDISA